MGIKKPKAKGKRAENRVAEILTKLQNIEQGIIHRAQASGTFKYEYGGDIKFNYSLKELRYIPLIEVKNRENQEQKHVFEFKNPIQSQYSSIKDKALELEKKLDICAIPFLIFTKNYEDLYILSEEKYFLEGSINKKIPENIFNISYCIKTEDIISNNYKKIYIFRLSEVIRDLNPFHQNIIGK